MANLHFLWTMRTTHAPPLERQLPRPPRGGPIDRTHARRAAARWTGAWAGTAWTGVLLALLLGLGRVPWLEATVWSLASGIVVWRTVLVGSRRVLDHLLEVCTLELGPSDPQDFARRIRRRAGLYGYAVESRLHADAFRPRRGAGLLPPLRVAWSGPGAVLQGPRFLVRSFARLAVG